MWAFCAVFFSNYFADFAVAVEGNYPSKPISIIVAYSSGGQGDTFARLVGEHLSTVYKQSVIVDNRLGVSGTLGTRLAVKSKNDGYTLLMGQTGEVVVNRVLFKNLGYDPLKELLPIVLIGNAPLVLLVPIDAPYNTLNEFIQAAKIKTGGFSYASVGAGTPGHLAAEALALGANINMVHVPYKGVGLLMSDLMASRVEMFFSSASAAVPQLKGGRVKALAVTTTRRMASLAQVPTVSESLLPSFSYTLWGGLFAPADTPATVIQSLNREVNAFLASPNLRSRFEADDLAVLKNSPAEFAQFVRAEAFKFEKLVKDTNLKVEP